MFHQPKSCQTLHPKRSKAAASGCASAKRPKVAALVVVASAEDRIIREKCVLAMGLLVKDIIYRDPKLLPRYAPLVQLVTLKIGWHRRPKSPQIINANTIVIFIFIIMDGSGRSGNSRLFSRFLQTGARRLFSCARSLDKNDNIRSRTFSKSQYKPLPRILHRKSFDKISDLKKIIAHPQFWKFDDFREADRIQALRLE